MFKGTKEPTNAQFSKKTNKRYFQIDWSLLNQILTCIFEILWLMHFGQIGCLSVVSSSRSSGGDVASLLHHRHTAFNNTSLFQMKIAMMMMMMMKYDYSH